MSVDPLERKKKDHVAYCNAQNNMVRLEFLRLNINDECNFSMGGVNVAYKLRNQYHFDLLLQNFK